MKALVVGATGATGKDLVAQLLEDEVFEEVDIFVRREVALPHPKLKVHVVDFEKMETWASLLQGDVLFSLLGTTRSQAGSKERQWRIDYDYQLGAAKAAAANGVKTYELMSAVGADPKSFFFYSKMKGALEEAVSQLSFSRIIIMQPPSLIRKGSDRLSEFISLKILKAFNAIGLLRSLKPVPTEVVARAMIKTAKDGVFGKRILSAKDM